MGTVLRLFLLDTKGMPRRFPITCYGPLFEGVLPVPEWAARPVLCAEIVLWSENRRPVRILRALYKRYSVDARGRIDQSVQEGARGRLGDHRRRHVSRTAGRSPGAREIPQEAVRGLLLDADAAAGARDRRTNLRTQSSAAGDPRAPAGIMIHADAAPAADDKNPQAPSTRRIERSLAAALAAYLSAAHGGAPRPTRGPKRRGLSTRLAFLEAANPPLLT